MSANLLPRPMDLFSAQHTTTPYVSEKQMRADPKNRAASLYALDRASGNWINVER